MLTPSLDVGRISLILAKNQQRGKRGCFLLFFGIMMFPILIFIEKNFLRIGEQTNDY